MNTFYKNGKTRMYQWLFLLLTFTYFTGAHAVMSGSYTLDPSAPASATNYVNLASFATDLYAGTRTDGGPVNGPGVSAAVVLRLVAGLNLTEQVEFRDASGSSASNSITIKGNSALLQFNSAVATSKHTVWLNGAKYYTFDSLNIRANSSTLAWGIRFSNDASLNTISNCSVILPNITSGVTTSTTSTTTQAAICFTASSSILDYTSNSAASAGNNGSNNKIINCVLGGTSTTLGPTYGIYENLTNTTGNNSYINNKIQHFYQEGLACHTADGIIINGNDFNRAGNSNIPAVAIKGINLYNNVRCSINPIVVTNNAIHDISTTSTLYGYYHINSTTYITGNNAGGRLSSFNNNKIYNMSTTSSSFYGIYVYTIRNTGGYEMLNNEVYKNVSTATTLYGIYTYQAEKMNENANTVRNNKGTAIYCLYDAGSSTNSTFTNNLVYKNIATGTEYGFYLGGTGAAWLGNKYANNTIAFDSAGWISANTYGFYISAGSAVLPKTNNSVFNNNIYIGHKGASSTAIKYGIYNLWGYTDYQEERNNVYFDTTNVTPASMFYGSEFSGPLIQLASLADWINLGFSNKDFNVNPYFIKSGYSDYKIGNMALNNIGTNVGITKDLVGTTRVVSAPDIGALESVFNLKVVSANTINSTICAGYSDTIKVTVGNSSAFAFKNLSVGVSLNGTLYTSKVVPNVAIGNTIVSFPARLLKLSKTGNNIVKYFIMGKDDISATDDTISKTINVIASPGGSVAGLKPGSKGMFNHPLGYDVTAFDENMVYTFSKPTKYTDAEFGTKWNVTTWATNASGTILPPVFTFTHPSSTELTFKPSMTYVDQFLFLYTRVTDILTGCDTTFIRKIFVAPRGIIRYTVPPAVCFLTDIDFVNNSVISSGDLSYTWDFGDGSAIYAGKFAKHNYAAAGKYNVTLTATSMPFGYISDTVFQVDVKEIPRTNFDKINACQGNNIVFNNTTKVNSGTPTYAWDFGDGSPISNVLNPVKQYTVPGVYTVKLTASKSGCEHTIAKNVYQFARPTANFVKNSGQCVNAPFTFDNTSTLTVGTNSTLWDFNDAGNTSTDHAPTYTFKTAGTKNVKLVVTSEFGCKDSVVKSITVAEAPVADFTFPAACDASPTNFNNTTSLNNQPLLGYNWDFGDGTVSSATNPVKSWSKAAVRQVKLKATLQNGCSSEITKTVTVGIQPKVDFDRTDACSGSPVSFDNLTDYNPSKILYTWSFGDGLKSNDNSPNHIYNTSVTQTFTVKLKGSIISGCSDSISKTVTVTALPSTCNFDITGNTNSATKTNFVFTPKGGSLANTEYTWSTGDGTTLTSSGAGVNYRYDAPGLFCVKMIAKNIGGCQCESIKCISLTTDITSAESMNSALSVYPNPSNGLVSVSFNVASESGMNIQVFNALGELVKTVHADGIITNIDLTEFASGVYVVKVLADGYTASKRITVSR